MARSAKGNGTPTLVADAEALPFGKNSLDLVMSGLDLHLVNDLPGVLTQIRYALKPDGLFLAALLGGETLVELRRAWLDAETKVRGGVSPRVAPFAELGDLAGLLQRAGFALPVADGDVITVSYKNPLHLMADLKAIGQSNTLATRSRTPVSRGLLVEAAERYAELYSSDDDRVPARFEILFLTAWSPAETQPKPLKPGSADARLADALNANEIALPSLETGDKMD
jgi:SAM-dependent methyltransferase